MAELVVHHYFPIGSGNIGDAMVARAIQEQLPRHLGPCRFVDVPVNDRYEGQDREIGLRGANVDRSNAEADLVVIGGSNLLEPRKARRWNGRGPRRGRWSVLTTVEEIARLRVPSMLVGMGTGSSFGQSIRPYMEPATSEIRALFARSFAHSVRDVVTVERLRQIDVQTRCDGCPVTFMSDAPVVAQSDEFPLAVSLPPHYIRNSLAGKLFMHGALSYIRWLHERKVPLLVTLQEDRDVAFARDHLPRGIEVFYTESLDEELDRFRRIRGMIAFRLHAGLTALALGKPIIPVGIDWRGLGFIRTIDAGAISIRSLRPFQFVKLRRLTERLLAGDRKLIEHLDAAKGRLAGSFDDFLDRAARTFREVRK
jgi:hypothetical protein